MKYTDRFPEKQCRLFSLRMDPLVREGLMEFANIDGYHSFTDFLNMILEEYLVKRRKLMAGDEITEMVDKHIASMDPSYSPPRHNPPPVDTGPSPEYHEELGFDPFIVYEDDESHDANVTTNEESQGGK